MVGRRSPLLTVEMRASSGKASDTRITLVKKRCAWYMRVKLKPHNELPYTEREELLEVMSMYQRAGVWPVDEGGSSGSSGPAVPKDVEESEPVKKLVAPTAPTATDREEHTASGHAVLRTWCRDCCIGRGRMHQHRAGGRETPIPAIAIDYGYLNERDDLLQEAAGAPILVSKCKRDRWIGAAIVPTKGADEYAVAVLKNGVICSGFTEVLVRSDNEPAILALKESAATALKLAGVNVKIRGECTVRLAKQRVGRERCERCKTCREKEFGLPRQTPWTGVSRRTPSPDLA